MYATNVTPTKQQTAHQQSKIVGWMWDLKLVISVKVISLKKSMGCKKTVPHSLQKWHAHITANLNPEWQNKTDAFLRQSQHLTDIVSCNKF